MAISDDMRRIHDEWSDSVRHRDVPRLAALYSPSATFESPAVLLLDDQFNGVITGREEIASFFNAFFEGLDIGVAEWFRTSDLFFDGRLMACERSAEDANGGAPRSVETVEIEDGLILHHRVYWSWAGLKALTSLLPARRAFRRAAPLILMKSVAGNGLTKSI